jgi:hypothetical protein
VALTRRYHLPSALRRTPVRIEANRARELVDGGGLLVDVRRHDDDENALHDGVRILPDMIPSRLESFPRDAPIVLACH